jgi:hypothetical protein
MIENMQREKFVSIVYKGFWNFQCKKAEGGMCEERKTTVQNNARLLDHMAHFRDLLPVSFVLGTAIGCEHTFVCK